ncbi:PREDICTED: paralemmin-3 [Chrysochloris asiatica]|uniref:Paralemmin-3 n=1 Tax=Chrysochloris asiatica TaxID=185453 RepID=A0A9B0WY41_CHRAS|nr:PREDICTED: paralemmin-3 [Chrysochloris asiatica]
MAESSLYRQRLEVIAEKRRLQEEIRAARLELEEEKLRVERLKRKSLRERWLMDGASEGPDWPKDPASQDRQSPEDQAQARIQNLEDSLFTLQSELQLLQSASTGAQHKPLGRPTWRRQGHRPLSQPTVEAGPADLADLDKRASLPPGPAGMSLESPSESRKEVIGVLPVSTGTSSETNGPCSEPSPHLELNKGATVAERGVGPAKAGGVVKVVWEGLRATQPCAMEATGPELEAKVEEVVLEAIGDRQVAGSPELPSWVKEDRDVVEVVWEGVGDTEGRDLEGIEEGGRGREAAQRSSLRVPEELQEAASRKEEGAHEGSPDGNGQGSSGGEEGSFIWVERVALSEEWEELQVEGLGPMTREGGKGLLGTDKRRSEENWKVERIRVEDSLGDEKKRKGDEEKPATERGGAEEPPGVETKGGEGQQGTEGEGSLKIQREGSGEQQGTERRAEDTLGREMEGGEEQLGTEKRAEEKKKEVEDVLGEEKKGGEVQPGEEKTAAEEPLVVERKEGEEPLETERKGGEEPLETERKGGQEALETEKKGGQEPLEVETTPGFEEDQSSQEQRESGGAKESQAEEMSDAGAPLGSKEEPRPEEEGLQPQEKQEGSAEEETAKPQTPAKGQGPSGDATPPLAEISTVEQPSECQPLLTVEGPSANPSAHPVPTYAPARQPEPPAPIESEETSGPKQKMCQCCAVM